MRSWPATCLPPASTKTGPLLPPDSQKASQHARGSTDTQGPVPPPNSTPGLKEGGVGPPPTPARSTAVFLSQWSALQSGLRQGTLLHRGRAVKRTPSSQSLGTSGGGDPTDCCWFIRSTDYRVHVVKEALGWRLHTGWIKLCGPQGAPHWIPDLGIRVPWGSCTHFTGNDSCEAAIQDKSASLTASLPSVPIVGLGLSHTSP